MPEPHQASLGIDAPGTASPRQRSSVTATFAVPGQVPTVHQAQLALQVPAGWQRRSLLARDMPSDLALGARVTGDGSRSGA